MDCAFSLQPVTPPDVPDLLGLIRELARFERLEHEVNFSTFVGRRGLYLEDLYVRPEHRGRGYGKAMLTHLARLAVERGCGRMEWAVLDWNVRAEDFYRSLGAEPKSEWRIFRLAGPALAAAASSGGPPDAN